MVFTKVGAAKTQFELREPCQMLALVHDTEVLPLALLTWRRISPGDHASRNYVEIFFNEGRTIVSTALVF
jgi:hypothetical protein